MKNSKKSMLKRHKFLGSMVILALIACGPSFDWSDYISYFQPDSAEKVALNDDRYNYSPLLFATDNIYIDEETLTTIKEPSDSIQIFAEWKAYLKGQVSDKSLEEYLFADSIGTKANNDLKSIPAVAEYFETLRQSSYMGEEWEQEIDMTAVNKKISFFETKFKQAVNNRFMQERYGLQVINANADAFKYQEALDFYEKSFQPIATKSAASVRAKARYFGAMLRLKPEQGFYEFAQLFEQYPHLRSSADLSVRTSRASYSPAILALCQNNHEKANVHALASIQPNVDGLPHIQQVFALEPSHPMLEFLMAREINRNEFLYFKIQDPLLDEKEYEANPSEMKEEANLAKSYFAKLKQLGLEIAKSKAIKTPAFWLTASAHCAFIDGNYAEARSLLTAAQAKGQQKPALTNQIALQEMLLLTKENKQITPEFETKVMPFIETFKARQNRFQARALAETSRYLSSLYVATQQKELKTDGWLASCSSKDKNQKVWQTANGVPFAKGKALFFKIMATEAFTIKNDDDFGQYYESQDEYNQVEEVSEAEAFSELLALAEQSNPSAFDQRIISFLNKDKLKTSLAKRYLAEHQYEKALETSKSLAKGAWVEEKYNEYFSGNPFSVGPFEGGLTSETDKFGPTEFIEKMAELSKKDDAESLYFLGCGAFNLSFFGNSWVLTRNWRSNYELDNPSPVYFTNKFRKVSQDDYYQLKTAESYFKKAFAKATDRELKARITFAQSMIEQSRFELEYAKNQPPYGADWEDYEKQNKQYELQMQKRRKEFQKSFTMLKNEYADTQFQKLALKECSTYEHFVSGK